MTLEGSERVPEAPALDLQGAILESALDSIIVMDAGGIVREFNPAAERAFGYRREQCVGREMAELIIPAELRDAHRRGLARAVTTGDAPLLGQRLEMPAIRADGAEFPIELTIGRTSTEPPLFIGYIRDLTRQKAAEASLVDRTRLASLAADVGTTLTRADTLTEMLQECAQAVVSRLDAAFARIWTLNTAEQVLELQASAGIYTHLNGPHGRVPVGQFKIGMIAAERRPHLTNEVVGDPRVGDQDWARREGMVSFAGYPLMIGDEIVGVLAMFAKHRLSDSDFDGLATVAHGIALGIARQRGVESLKERAAELTALTSALERTNRELDQFAYVASHDLKAPLRGIANLSQWIEEDLGTDMPPLTREHLTLMRGRVHRLEALIDGVLEYSRAGRVIAAPEVIDTGTLVREVAELLSLPAEVRIDIAPDLPTLTTERLPLQQVLLNLIGNAVKYSGAACVVRIEAQPDGHRYAFRVIDNGPGISPQFHERVWGIFQTLQPRDKVEGTGIGLALVKKIVEGRGGRVWLESSEGHGATFGFTW